MTEGSRVNFVKTGGTMIATAAIFGIIAYSIRKNSSDGKAFAALGALVGFVIDANIQKKKATKQ